jgi:hypothetical protein
MPWIAAAVGGGLGLLGSSMAGRSAEKAAGTSAQAQLESARIAASAGAFKPVGITTRFGTSNFTMGTDQYGNPTVTAAGYQATPEIQALQDRLSALYRTSLGQAEQAQAAGAPLGAAAQGLFGLGQQYLAKSPEQAAQDYYNQQQAMLAPTRQQEEQRLGAGVFGRGRAGLNISGQGQPELNALAQARRQQDLALAAQAEQQAQQRIGFGAGLFGTGAQLQGNQYALQTQALSPFQTQFGVTQALEQAALQPLEIGAQLGGRNVNTAGAQALLQGGLGAAQTQLQGSLVGPSAMMNTLASTGQQYFQNQNQQALLRQLGYGNYGGNTPQAYYGSVGPTGNWADITAGMPSGMFDL